MSKKAILTIIIILFFAGGLYVYENVYKKVITPLDTKVDTDLQVKQNSEIKVQENQKQTQVKPIEKQPEQSPVQNSEARFSDGSEIESLDIAVFEVLYDGKSFLPSSLEIKVGDYVIFKNTSTENFWPASGNHPDHLLYPEFDAKKSITPGSQYKFNFLKKGTWSYHNHLRPEITGLIVVK